MVGDFRVDILGRHLEGRAFRNKIADLLKESLVGRQVDRRAMVAVPAVDLFLDFVALLEKRTVFRREVAHNCRKSRPEITRLDPGSGDGLAHHEIVEGAIYLQSVDRDPIRHKLCSEEWAACAAGWDISGVLHGWRGRVNALDANPSLPLRKDYPAILGLPEATATTSASTNRRCPSTVEVRILRVTSTS